MEGSVVDVAGRVVVIPGGAQARRVGCMAVALLELLALLMLMLLVVVERNRDR